MTFVVIFPSVLGARPGIAAAAEMLREAGHTPHVVDVNDGQVFDDYEPAMQLMRDQGWPARAKKALEACAVLPSRYVALGFSAGNGLALHLAASRPGAVGVVMLSGAEAPEWLDVQWPPGIPGQIHVTAEDPWRDEGIELTRAAIEGAGGQAEVFEYPGKGHVFADPSKTDEYQPVEAELMWSRVLAFLDAVG